MKAFSALRGNKAPLIGILTIVAVLVFGYLAFQKNVLTTVLSFGDTVEAEFPQGYKLEPYRSDVKIADVDVGKVTGVELTDRETVLVTMKLDSGTVEKLGSTPSSTISATTLLGGIYYVALVPGGDGAFTGDRIPLERTSTPVELGDALTAFTPDALMSYPKTITQFDATLAQGGRDSIRSLLDVAPGAFGPTAEVLGGLRGTRPDSDLTGLVTGLETMADGLLLNDGQLDTLFTDFDRSTAALAAGSRPLAESVSTGGDTLRVTRAGLDDLRGTLHKLISTSNELRPTARELDDLFDDLDPVLKRARPVVHDLREVLDDLRPLIDQLKPTAAHTKETLDDLEGPLARLNGPIADMVLNPWRGEGVYAGGGSDNRFYEEVGYLAVNGALAWQTHDANGAHGRLMAGGGGQTMGGSAFPNTIEEYMEGFGMQQPPGPQEAQFEQADQAPVEGPR